MYQLLIVDDEPLVQAGIRSMLNWNELNIEICGTAMNGQAALRIIEEKSPEIVITDIKMPVMSGLDLAKVCRERYGENCPYFIILTFTCQGTVRYEITNRNHHSVLSLTKQ